MKQLSLFCITDQKVDAVVPATLIVAESIVMPTTLLVIANGAKSVRLNQTQVEKLVASLTEWLAQQPSERNLKLWEEA